MGKKKPPRKRKKKKAPHEDVNQAAPPIASEATNGEIKPVIPAPQSCCFPGCARFAEHRHHITYDPEVIKPLCRQHHEEITIINGQQGRKIRCDLSNKHRWWIWYQWTGGKLKPRRTKKALEYLEGWDSP